MRSVVCALLMSLVGATAAAKELVVYTDRQERLMVFLVAAFEATSGVKARVVYGDVPDLVDTYRDTFQRYGELPFDVILTKDVGSLSPLLSGGVLTPIASDSIVERTSDAYRDEQRRWVGVSRRTRAIHVSAERVAPGEITSYEDLADPKWRGRVCLRRLDHSYNVQLVAAMVAQSGEEFASSWYDGVRENLARDADGSDRDQIIGVAKGECDVALANSYYRGIMLQTPNQQAAVSKTRIVMPEFSGGGGFVMLTAAGVVKGGKQQEDAEKFIEFLLSDTGQRIMMLLVHEHPAAVNTPMGGQVAKWGDIETPKHPVFAIIENWPSAKDIADHVANGEAIEGGALESARNNKKTSK